MTEIHLDELDDAPPDPAMDHATDAATEAFHRVVTALRMLDAHGERVAKEWKARMLATAAVFCDVRSEVVRQLTTGAGSQHVALP